MEGQMTIFDFMGEFANLPEEQMVEILGMKLGIKFTPEVLPEGTWRYRPEYRPEYEYKRKGLKLTVGYLVDVEGKTFISAGYSKSTFEGGGPYYSIDDAARYFKRILEEYG